VDLILLSSKDVHRQREDPGRTRRNISEKRT